MTPRLQIERLYRRHSPVIRDTQRVLVLPAKCWRTTTQEPDVFQLARERRAAAVARVLRRAAS